MTGYDAANADAAARADATRATLDFADYNAGQISAADYQRRQGTYGVDQDDQRQEIQDTFDQAVVDQAGKMADGTAGVLNGMGATIWRALPWWVWLGAGVALFLYLGGGVWLRAAIKRHSA